MTEKDLEQYRDIKRERDHLLALMRKDEVFMIAYRDKVQQLLDQLNAIERAIETLEPRERQAIRMHYFEGLPWELVGYKMYYERSQIFRIRKSAIEKLKNA